MNKHFLEAQRVVREEIVSLEASLVAVEPNFGRVVDLILGASGRVVVTGLGKSGLIGHKISATLASTGTPSIYLNASEALHGDLGMVSPGDVVLMLSNSAATTELIKMLPSLKQIGTVCIGLFGKKDGPLCADMHEVLYLGDIKEACPLNLAPMSSTTCALVIGDALAAALMKERGVTESDFAVFHPGGSLGRRLLLKVADVMPRTEKLPAISREATLREVVIEIGRMPFGAICVTDASGVLEGIITDGDIRRYLTKSDDLSTTADAIMTKEPLTTSADTKLGECLALMEGRSVYMLPVIDEDRVLQGMVRMHDVLSS